MKKTIYALVLVWVVGLSAVCLAGEESWSILLHPNEDYSVKSVVPFNGGVAILYSASLVTKIAFVKDGVVLKEKSFSNTANPAWDLYPTQMVHSVEDGEEFLYFFGMMPVRVSLAKAFLVKLNSELIEVWDDLSNKMMMFDDFEVVYSANIVDNLYIFIIGGTYDKKVTSAKIGLDHYVSYVLPSDVYARIGDVEIVNGEAIAVGYKSGDCAKVLRINISNGQIGNELTFGAGERMEFYSIKKRFTNGAHVGYFLSGAHGYASAYKRNWFYTLDLNLQNLKSIQITSEEEVALLAPCGANFIVRYGTFTGFCDYHIVSCNGTAVNTVSTFDMMTDSYGQIVMGDVGAYYGASRLNDNSGVMAYYYKPNHPPVADAGDDQIVSEGATVQLVGTGSDPDDTDLVYFWTQVYGPTVALIVATANDVSFIAPTVGPDGATLEFQLSASDGSLSDTDTLVVHVTNVNQSPVAYAGPDLTEDEGVAVTLAGSGNDPDGDAMTYQWTQTSGPAVILTHAATNHPSFTTPQVDADGVTLTFELTVSDGVLSTTDTCVVNVTYENEVPQAGAGDDQTATEGETVTLAGAGADPDGHDVTYQWTQVSGPAVLLVNPDTAHPTFTAPGVDHSGAALAFQLTVSDGNLTATDTCVVNVTYDNQVPLSDAGNDQAVDENANVTLSGTGSDPDGEDVTFLWTQISGTTVTLINSTSGTASFTAPSVGESGGVLTFRLTVSDGSLAKTDTCTITVNNVAGVDPDPDPDPDPDDDDDDPAEKSDGGGGGGCFIGSLM